MSGLYRDPGRSSVCLGVLLGLSPIVTGCGSKAESSLESPAGSQGGTSTSAGGSSAQGGSGAADGAGGSANTGGSATSGGSAGAGATSNGGGGPGPGADYDCEPTVSLADTSSATAVIGLGTPESCNETDLRTAAEQGGVITFDCGPDPVTIDITQTMELPTDADTVIDGNNLVTLDAGKLTRHFLFDDPGWMDSTTHVVLQRLTLQNGKAPAGEYFPPLEDPECAYGYKEGSGGVIYMRNGNLQVIDCQLLDNEAALLGPDVGGGAVYAVGSASVIISGSRFAGNRASNGGAIGLLFANPEIYNSVFENNTAEGTGQNTAGHAGCPEFGHEGQGGAGGLSGAVYFDGLNDEDHVYKICDSVFRENKANELAGALFRTPNAGAREMLIGRCTFESNTADAGGVSFIKDNAVTVRDSLFANNRGGINVAGEESEFAVLGGLWVNNGSVDVANSTFVGNNPSGLDVELESVIKNSTFASNRIGGTYDIQNSLFSDVECDDTQAGAHNVQWPQGTACAEGTAFADPGLGALADNGGPTQTLLPANTAAVSGVGSDCPSTDQRGEARDTASCAAGAVEQ